MEISYKIPFGHILLLLGAGVLLTVGTFGFLDDSFQQTPKAKLISLISFIFAASYFLITPRNKKIVATETGISVPKILLPPYGTTSCQWKDIIEVSEKHDNGNYILILKTRSRTIKIYGWLCFKNFEFMPPPKLYTVLYFFIQEKIEQS